MNPVPARADGPRVALVTYSTKARGGVVHTLSLADAMADRAMQVRVVALGNPGEGFFRSVRAPYSLVLPSPPADTLEGRVFASIDDLEEGLSRIADEVDIIHTQDCISARAAARVRDAGARVRVVRTVHHVDDFTSAALVTCQRKAIDEPDQLVVVSEDWRNRLKADYGVDAVVIHNGVDADRFTPIDPGRRAARRQGAGVADRFMFLSVGGIEPRKGSAFLMEAMAILKQNLDPSPVLVVVGGHTFQDYTRYRDDVLAALPGLGLHLGRDVVLAGSVSDAELHEWYRSADALVFPSVKEGWGLAVLEAMAADLPVVSSDIAVLREYLTPDRTAVMTRVGSPESLAAGMRRLVTDPALRQTLVRGGRDLLPAFTWQRAAGEHASLYAQLAS
ncbi:MAG TPA: MSMEG_0565 family glycosyltransferase [Nocardioides sp.]|uniref:MSMEG_0565 family glycosyltransferase n=1 Tax=Nocardioides sp. TaxID=35761 RepID=UPI002E316D52|nr:MSMEG_0565 family glycosyltransferase [Nocardioides sp.]HEX5087769.1 MSMEG_0565 family glycosyltransferase [Nocardioides sp.]